MRYAGFKFAASIVLAMSFGCSHVRQLEPAQIQSLCPARFGAPGTTGPPIVGLAVIHLFNEPRRSFRMRPVNGEALPSGVVVRTKPVLPVGRATRAWQTSYGVPLEAWQSVGHWVDGSTVIRTGTYQVEMRYAAESPRSSADVCVVISAPFQIENEMVIVSTDTPAN